jgi:coproporphyrinogen III oxidase-like Fe-S oxidoreductase
MDGLMAVPLSWSDVEEEREVLGEDALAEERILVGLRLAVGVEVTPKLQTRFGMNADQLIIEGLLERSNDRWRATRRGRLLLNTVTSRLILG